MASRDHASSIWDAFYQDNPALSASRSEIEQAEAIMTAVLASGLQILVCGNGGSAADSEHIAGELAKPCALARPLTSELRTALSDSGDDGYLADNLQLGLPVLPLVSQAALITAIANDQGGDLIFAQQVVAYGREGDLLWSLSTSGNSRNTVHAARTARAMGLRTLAFTGSEGGELAELCEVTVRLPGASTPEIQTAHQRTYHALCLAIEARWYAP